jgi:signal transduction histidine kinase
MAGSRRKDGSTAEPSVSELSLHLAEELRLPLSALIRLGERCAASKESDLAAAGRAVARECERLDVFVANTLELGVLVPEPPSDTADLLDVVEKAVAGHRALLEGLSVRVRVLESTREAWVVGARAELLEVMAALFSDLLERVPRRSQVEVRVRDVVGRVRVDCTSTAAAPPVAADRATIRRAREVLARLGGEVWEVCDDERGFGLALAQWRRAGEGAHR